jgi:glycine/D-amino acid oxidase-like deaminating enzyme/nitrite reductase/ring-hydroxylating ferredoxin subunit
LHFFARMKADGRTQRTVSTWARRARGTNGASTRTHDELAGRIGGPGELAGERTVDVCIVGAGIAGVSVAYELARQGARVLVLDQGVIGGGETALTSAHLTSALDDRFYRLEKLHGPDGARLAGQSHAVAIDLVENNARTLGIDCDFRRIDGYLFAGAYRPADELARELEAATRAGIDVELVAGAPLPFAAGPALRFSRQARFHPLAYVNGMARAVVDHGGSIHTGVHVGEVKRGENQRLEVQLAGGGRVHADAVVDATNGTITSMMKLPMRQSAYRSYVIALERRDAAVPDALFWDTEDPYHYLRIATDADGRELVLVGGEDHRVGQDEEPSRRWGSLERWIRERVSGLGATIDRWSGQIMEPADGLGFVGRSPDLDGVYVVTGDSGEGLTHAVIASVIVPELILGHDHPWVKIYEPSRSMLRAAGTLVKDAMAATVQYADWIAGGDVDDVARIPNGQGAVVRKGVHLLAVYRDEDGRLHTCSARCPHKSAVVAWNEAERTWDCPAHGSRFDACGHVLHGPAIGDLTPPPGEDGKEPAQPTAPGPAGPDAPAHPPAHLPPDHLAPVLRHPLAPADERPPADDGERGDADHEQHPGQRTRAPAGRRRR